MGKRLERQSKRIHSRELRALPMRQSFLIFCEGSTEVGYFSSFKKRAKVLGEGNALKIVESAIAQKKRSIKKIDQYWVVFDKDETPALDFDQAIHLARANGINVAWSNQAFELWFILHYQELFNPCDRRRYEEILRRHLQDYASSEKGVEQGRRLFNQTYHLISTAIDRATKGHSLFGETIPPSGRESSTTVYILINAITDDE